MNAITTLWEYKALERREHILPDDILNKITQEVIELLAAIELWDDSEIFSEAGDVLVNVVSFAQELWYDISELLALERWRDGDILWLTGAWNEQVQALRWRYSRKQGNPWEVESLTKSFISTLLNYTHPEKNLWEVLEANLRKMSQREGMYKPDINVKDYIAEYPDFPKEGINFKDISPILANPDALRYVCMEMAESCRGANKIVALDSRGFIFAPMIAQRLNIPWVMARKPGKLPGETESISYDLEYGSNTIEIQKGAIEKGEKVAIVDDLLATGGTAMAAVHLVEFLGGEIHNCSFVISLDDDFLSSFEKRKQLACYPTSSVVSYED